VRLWVEERGEKVGNFGVSPNGDVTLLKPMDYELRQKYTFLVHATDGIMVRKTSQIYLKIFSKIFLIRIRLRKWRCAC